jgi:hypothetical protein
MFDSVNPPRVARRKQIVTAVGSSLAHAAIVGLALAIPLFYFTEPLPQPPDMLAFVMASPPPPPPPPPPPAAPQKPQPAKPKVIPKADPVQAAIAAPVEAPAMIAPERPLDLPQQDFVAGGVEGGDSGGIAGGIIGGLPIRPAPPPPPPPAPAPVKPIRIGGDIDRPTLLHRRCGQAMALLAVAAQRTGPTVHSDCDREFRPVGGSSHLSG